MPNMSYCRFRNTLTDLRDCHENLDDTPEELEEVRARERLVKLCIAIAEDYGPCFGFDVIVEKEEVSNAV